MESNRLERDENVTVVTGLKRILREDRRITAASRTAAVIGNPPIEPQTLDAALEEVVAPIQRAEVKDTFAGLTDRPGSEEGHNLRLRPSQSCPSERLEDTVCGQIVRIPALVQVFVV